MSQTPKITKVYKDNGFIGLSQCPGKNCQGRNGNLFKNNLKKDLLNFKSQNVSIILCLLNKYELWTLGVDLSKYQDLSKNFKIEFFHLEIIEMGVPTQSEKTIRDLLDYLVSQIKLGKGLLIHCRGGVGWAGLMAGMLLKDLGQFQDVKKCLLFLWKTRHKRCVESMKQVDYL